MVFFANLTPEQIKQLTVAINRPEGSFVFDVVYDSKLFDKNMDKLILLDFPSGKLVFRLVRESNLDVTFIYSSPSTGTRIATVNIESLKLEKKFKIIFTWSPENISLAFGVMGKKPFMSEGWQKADYDLMVDKNGQVVQVGDKGIDISGVFFVQNGKTVLESTAIKTWDETLNAIKVLQKGTSPDGYLFESILSNQLISLLCTSLEIYCRKRFIELIGEGIKPEYRELEKVFLTNFEKNQGMMKSYSEEAQKNGETIAEQLIKNRKIDFGNYQDLKDAYSKGYGLKFPDDVGVDGKTINSIIEFIGYRHRIIHVAPCNPFLNQIEVPPKKPVFANKATVDLAVKNFDAFIRGLHAATLELRPKDASSPNVTRL